MTDPLRTFSALPPSHSNFLSLLSSALRGVNIHLLLHVHTYREVSGKKFAKMSTRVIPVGRALREPAPSPFHFSVCFPFCHSTRHFYKAHNTVQQCKSSTEMGAIPRSEGLAIPPYSPAPFTGGRMTEPSDVTS